MSHITGEITVTVKPSPRLVAITEALQAADELAELIPDWHSEQRDELLAKIERGLDAMIESLETEGEINGQE